MNRNAVPRILLVALALWVVLALAATAAPPVQPPQAAGGGEVLARGGGYALLARPAVSAPAVPQTALSGGRYRLSSAPTDDSCFCCKMALPCVLK
jgi:hypothetical protein